MIRRLLGFCELVWLFLQLSEEDQEAELVILKKQVTRRDGQ